MRRIAWALAVSGFVMMAGNPASAQVTLDLSKVTCEQWLSHKIADLEHIAIWLSGYYNGKRDNTVIDVQASKQVVERIKDKCYGSLKAPLMQTLERELGGTR